MIPRPVCPAASHTTWLARRPRRLLTAACLAAPVGALLAALVVAAPARAQAPAAAWQPTAPVELVVPAGTGGGADQMARLVAQLVASKGLMKQPITVLNKPGDSGLEGLLDMKASRGNPHKLVITLSNIFTAPLAFGVDFSWKDLTPVQLLALDQFVLWVNAASPHRTVKDLVEAMRAGAPGSFRLGGTGSKQEDQLVGVLLEAAAGTRLSYVPLKGGGDVARALADGEVELTVNNPIEAEGLWRLGKLRPLCVFDSKPLQAPQKVAGNQGWADLPTCMAAGVPTQYQMMRGIFTTPGATPAQVAFYNQLFERLRALPEWKEFMQRGAFRVESLQGPAFDDWLEKANRFHGTLMREARLKLGSAPAPAPAATPRR